MPVTNYKEELKSDEVQQLWKSVFGGDLTIEHIDSLADENAKNAYQKLMLLKTQLGQN